MPILQASPFLERLLRFLIPYFTGITADIAGARVEALEILASYGARTRAELLCAVQIIVFSFAALDTLAESNAAAMSPSMRIRFRGCANNLSRSGQKTEQTLAKRLACDAPGATDIQVDPTDDIPDDVAEAILQQTQATMQEYRDYMAANRSAHGAQPRIRSEKDKHPQGAAVTGPHAGIGMQVQPSSGT
jgi:hypothetical protein